MLLILESRVVKGYSCKLAALSDVADYFVAAVNGLIAFCFSKQQKIQTTFYGLRVKVIRILAWQIVRFAAMAASPFSLVVDSWLRIHTTVFICRVMHRSVIDCAYEALENHYSYWDAAGHRRVMQVFVGCLGPNVTAGHIKHVFSHYGQLGHVKIPLALGRAESHYNGGCYGYEKGYKTYGCAQVAQDLARYYGVYAAGYGVYPQAQQEPQAQQKVANTLCTIRQAQRESK
nr:hypothetical protein [Tanacetum cinerariifolium]